MTKLEHFQTIASTKTFQSKFIMAQAEEICSYINNLKESSFKAWEGFIRDAIDRNKSVFLYDFYLVENEYGVIKPDIPRINDLILKDPLLED